MLINKILSFLDKLNSSKKHKFFNNFLSPISTILEYYCYRKIWKKDILIDILENDEFVLFMNKNQFLLDTKKWKFVKAEYLSSEDQESNLFGLTTEQIENLLNKEYSLSLIDILEKNFENDIINYTSINTTAEYYMGKNIVYRVNFGYYRRDMFDKSKTKTIIWFLIVMFMLSLPFFKNIFGIMLSK